MFGFNQLILDIQKLKELIEIRDIKYKSVKEENERLKDELEKAYDFIDRYVYHRERIKDKDISDEEIEDIKLKLKKKFRDDLHSIGAFLPK